MIAPNFKLLVKTFIKKGDSYLCIQRSTHEGSNQHAWDLPGGKLEFGEELIVALNREISEEVGLRVENLKPFFTTSFMQEDKFVVAILYEADYLSGEVVLSNEHEDFKWLSKKLLNSVKFQEWIIPSFNELN